ncbi:MAG: hypothetical protein ACI4NE_00805 [Succinivibrio sp.]
MNSLNVVKTFDKDLYAYFVKEIERQHASISFIPDENSTSPICASIMGSILVNSANTLTLGKTDTLESLTVKRLCDLFGAPCATVRTITIEAASRVVFKALTTRGDVVMSLDLRKKEHCNSENLAFRFVNFGIDPETQLLDMDNVEALAKANKPKLIIISPVNYSQQIDFARFSKIAKDVGALLWCDISQTVSLTAAGVIENPMKYADVVTFSTHGAMQGPQAAVILCRKEIAGLIDRAETMAGHNGLLSPQLSSLAVRLHEMKTPGFKQYCQDVVANARALEEGLVKGGMKIISQSTKTHLVMVDTRVCAISARGAQELLADLGVHVRIAQVYTNNPNIKFDCVRFSSHPATTRGVTAEQMKDLGYLIGSFLSKPDEENGKKLNDMVASLTSTLPALEKKYMDKHISDVLSADYED